MKKLNQEFSIITFDLAIYKVAKKVQRRRPDEFSKTIIRLGGFHVVTNFLGVLSTMYQTNR